MASPVVKQRPEALDMKKVGKVFRETDNEGDKASIEVRQSHVPLSPSMFTRKGFLARNLKKMDDGSLRGATISMAISSMGSGILAMPFVCAQNGWILGLFLITFGAVGCYWSLYMLI